MFGEINKINKICLLGQGSPTLKPGTGSQPVGNWATQATSEAHEATFWHAAGMCMKPSHHPAPLLVSGAGKVGDCYFTTSEVMVALFFLISWSNLLVVFCCCCTVAPTWLQYSS